MIFHLPFTAFILNILLISISNERNTTTKIKQISEKTAYITSSNDG